MISLVTNQLGIHLNLLENHQQLNHTFFESYIDQDDILITSEITLPHIF